MKYTKKSSGRWDATGNFEAAVQEQQRLAREWAENIPLSEVVIRLEMMLDPNALTLYQRDALIQVAIKLLKKGEE